MAIEICNILYEIHKKNIIHKNINPSNIIWNTQNNKIRIIDFGISSETNLDIVELQNPEITEFSGSGDVAKKNYRKIAALAVLSKNLEKKEMENWIEAIGMPGFAPTQGHIPSAVPYVGHAIEAMRDEAIQRVMFLAKASIFLNRLTNLFDGVSFLLERNPQLPALVKNKKN